MLRGFPWPYIDNFNPSTEVPPYLEPVNSWILHQSSTCFTNYMHYFELNEFSLALNTIEKFFWHDFCDNYLEIIKDQLFNQNNYNPQVIEATKWTLYTVGFRILQLYAPFTPHITEILYGLLYKNRIQIESIHQTRYQKYQQLYIFEQSTRVMEAILGLISQVRKLKTEQQLSLKTELATLTISAQDLVILQALEAQETLIKAVTRAQTIEYTSVDQKKSELKAYDNAWHAQITLS